MKRLISWLMAVCMMMTLVTAVADDDVVTYEEILAKRQEIAAMEAELADMEARYAAQNANRVLVFDQDEYFIVLDDRAKIVPEVIRVTEDAPKRTTLVWSTSDRGVAAVDKETGLVQAVRLGTATITCYAKDDANVSRSVTVHVIRPVREMQVSRRNVYLTVREQDGVTIGETYQITLEITPANAYDKSVTWWSADESVATVDENGLVTAVGMGETLIHVKANDGSDVRSSSRIHVEQGVETITMTEPAVTVYENEKHSLDAEVSPRSAANRNVVWSSSDESIATVSSSGRVTGVDTGVCTIYATAADGSGVVGSCTVTVLAYVSKITAEPGKIYLKQGGTYTPSVSVAPDDAHDKRVTFSTDDPAVATVNEQGMITATGAGECRMIVTAADGSGTKATVNVYVEPLIPLTMEGMDISHNLLGVPQISPTVVNRSFGEEVTSFTVSVVCRNAYGEIIIPAGAESTVQRYTWSHGCLGPGESLTEETWFAQMTGFEMIYSVEAWLDEVVTADGAVHVIPAEDARIFTWVKY